MTRRWWTASSGSFPCWGRRKPWLEDTRFAPRPVQRIWQTLQSALPHVCIQPQNVTGRRLEEIDIDDLPMEDTAEDDDLDLDEYSFSKFASTYFQGAATPTYLHQRLRQPLLHHEDKEDVLVIVLCRLNSPARQFLSEGCPCLWCHCCLLQASLTVWWIILRFMGDLPEPKATAKPRDSLRRLVVTPPPLSREFSKHLMPCDGTKRDVLRPQNGRDDLMMGEGATLDRPLTALEKLHIIVGYAIIRSDLR